MCVYQKWQKNLNTHTHTLGNDNTHVLQERKMKTDSDGGDVAVFDDLWFLLVLRYHLIPIPSQYIPQIYTHTHIEHTHTHARTHTHTHTGTLTGGDSGVLLSLGCVRERVVNITECVLFQSKVDWNGYLH